jgi:MOSC domain-containing protein YiiM
MSGIGKVEAIYIYPTKGAEAVELNNVNIIEGKGLDGDHPRREDRAVTLLSLEAWGRALADLGDDLPPYERRANVVVSGVNLSTTIDKIVRLGQARLHVRWETTPCQRMDAVRQGLREALRPEMRGGVTCAVVAGGRLSVGDMVIVEK